MHTVELDLGPSPPSYDSFEAAIAGPEAQAEQESAREDTKLIGEAFVESGAFGRSSCMIRFSSGWHLVAEARHFSVRWTVTYAQPSPLEVAPPVQLLSGSGECREFDPMAMLAQIVGARFIRLYVTGRDLLLYTRGNDILWLQAFQDRRTSTDFLYAFFEK